MARCVQRIAGIVSAHGSAKSNCGWLRAHAGILIAAPLFIFSVGSITGCGAVSGFNPSASYSASAQQSPPPTFTTIYSFTGGDDGAYPQAGLIRDSTGNLYGTTSGGGSAGHGTVFKIDPSGNETVLYNFTGGADGDMPVSELVMDSKGNLYGTTIFGGHFDASLTNCNAGCGTVFKIDPSGNETVLHSFTGGVDGAYPEAGLIVDSTGNLYGTTYVGGALTNCFDGCGTVFKIDPSGNKTVLYSFTGGADGAYPEAGLIMDSTGNLYGTAAYGGSFIYDTAMGSGTAFKIDPSGHETVLHAFTGGSDGDAPIAGLVMDSAGNFFGTTIQGGPALTGTVFKISASGNESVLYSFTGGADGSNPQAGLVMDPAGNLYGTTLWGGSMNYYGTVFKVDSSGSETVLHSFTSDDGNMPVGGLVMDSAGNLYGTTFAGGSSDCGTVFKITLTAPFSAFSVKMDITAGPPPGFQLKALFTQGSEGGAIDPVSQGMMFAVGPYTATIPAGSFHMVKKGWFVYEGTINGVALQIRILQTATNSYQVQLEALGVDLTSVANPVPVTLTIGSNTGTVQVTAGH